MSELHGRHILVVGAASGIGRATARACAEAGARVAVIDRNACPDAHAAALVADVRDAAAIDAGVAKAAATIGGLDGVIYCAGIDLDASLAETVDDDWNRVLDVNLTGAMRVCRAALRAFPADGGTIVLFASGAGLRPLPRRTAYCAAKGGLVMFAKTLALDAAAQNVRVNAICPGPVDTPMFRDTYENAPDPEATLAMIRERYALRRIGSTDEIAAAALFLTSRASSFVTGIALAVDGGKDVPLKIVVVGAGVFGASTAYHLVRAGAEVVIVDAAHEGRATAVGAGIISPWSSRIEDPDFYRLSAAGGRIYPHLLAQLAEDGESDTGYRKVGALSVTADPGELRFMERLIRERQAPEAGEVSVLSPAEARELFPPLREDLAAVHLTGAARVDGRRLAPALLRAAARRGAMRREGVASLLIDKNRVRGVRVGAETIAADSVIVTAGAWAPQLLRPLGLRLAVEPQRGQIVHLRLPEVETGPWPVVLPLADHYLLTFDDSRVVVGATREWGSGFDYRVTAGGLAKVLRDALSVAPGLADATLIETRIGFRPMPADAKVMLGIVADGLAIGNGLGASGLTIGPYAGKLLAELVLHGKAEIDLAPYRPRM